MSAFPIDRYSSALNFVTVAGVNSPGRCAISGVRTIYKFDVSKPYGMSGAKTTYIGQDITRFILTITLFDDADFIQWPLFKAVLTPPTKAKPLVTDMLHPVLSSAGIRAVVAEEIGEPERQSNGFWVATIKCMQWSPPKPALVSPKGSVPGVAAKPIPPQTAAQKYEAKQIALNAQLRLHP